MNTIESAVSTDAKASGPLTDQSVAKQLLFGNVLEENLFPYPAINDRDREVLGMIVESIDRFLEGKQRVSPTSSSSRCASSACSA